MKLETRDFGVLEIKEEDIICFPEGMPGFLDKKKYYLINLEDNLPFYVLQSVEEKELAFITIVPWYIFTNYEFEISEQVQKKLKIESLEDVLVLVIGTIRGKVSEMTVNLAAPLVINHRSKLGKQVILDRDNYPVRQPVFKEVVKQEAK